VARGPVRALGTTGAWLERAGRIIASNQRLLVFPVVLQIAGALLMLPVTLASHSAVTFDVYARDASDGDRRFADLIRASSTSTGTFVAMALVVVALALASAWLAGSFIRSLGEGDIRWWPGRAFAPLAVLYLVSGLITLGIAVIATADDTAATAWLALLTVVVVSVPVLFADYAIVLEDRGVGGGIARSARIWLRRPGQCLMALFTFLILGQLVYELFVRRILDADGVFPGFFGAQLLVQALIAYVSDCVLIALLLETPDEPATAPESEIPE
jgi:hypothetical protein